jgi:drug/metabolite transporter (DMT)-like permease
MNRKMQGVLGVAAAQTLLGFLGLSVLESGADVLSVAFYRCAIGGLLLVFYCICRGELGEILRLPPRTHILALTSGLLMTGNWVLFFEGIHRMGIAAATILFHIQPFFVVLLGAHVFRERVNGVTFLWIGLALVGLILATGLASQPAGMSEAYLIGIACTLAAAFCYSLVTIIAKGIGGMKAPQLTLMQCLCGVLLLTPVLPLGPLEVSQVQWGWFAVIGIALTGGVYALLYTALPKLTTPVIAVLLFLYPASAVVVDGIAYGHMISLAQIAGLTFILLANLGVTLKWGAGPRCDRSQRAIGRRRLFSTAGSFRPEDR